MTPERWKEVKALLAAALDKAPERRADYLDQVCVDQSMRRELDSLLAAHEQGDDRFLEQPSSDKNELRSGTKLGSYEIVALLGAGGMGDVYQAVDTKLGRSVAIKVLPAAFVRDPKRLARFQREARLLASLNHPNIATIHGLEESDGIHYLVMELVPGRSLSERLRSGPLGIGDVLALGIQIAGALGAAHAQGIIHRDIKPANIVVSELGHAKVLDFGLAKLARVASSALRALGEESLSVPDGILGTVAYMSPEQVRGEDLDVRTDLFSFGLVLYETATGSRGFTGNTTGMVFDAILNRQPVSASEINRAIPLKLEEIIARALEKDRKLRYQTAQDMEAELQRLKRDLESGAVSARPATAESTGKTKNMQKRWRHALLWGGPPVLLAAVSVAIWYQKSSSPRLASDSPRPIESLAVLPIEELSGSPEQDYFADGMTDELITDLAQIQALRVISRTSVMLYKRAHKSLPDIARELKVDAVVEGTVLRSGNRVRITAQLVYAPADRQLWAESYERDLRDILGLQREVAKAVVDEIRIKVTPEEQMRLSRAPPVDSEAYDAYLKGQYYWETRSEEGLRKAISYFQEAIEKDPTSPRAYTGLADSYNALGSDRFLAPVEAFPKAKAAALEALQRDQNFAEAHASLAFAIWNYDYDWKKVETEYKRAIELNPGYATAYHWYSGYLLGMGRFAEAIAAVKKARELDPLSPRINANVGLVLYFARQYDQAIEELRSALRMDPNSEAPYAYLGSVYLGKRDYQEAIASFQKSKELLSDGGGADLNLAQAYALAGNRKEAQVLLSRSLARSDQNYESALLIAKVYSALGEKESAFAWLDKAYMERSSLLPFLSVDPELDVLHPDPRFQDLLRRMGLQN